MNSFIGYSGNSCNFLRHTKILVDNDGKLVTVKVRSRSKPFFSSPGMLTEVLSEQDRRTLNSVIHEAFDNRELVISIPLYSQNEGNSILEYTKNTFANTAEQYLAHYHEFCWTYHCQLFKKGNQVYVVPDTITMIPRVS